MKEKDVKEHFGILVKKAREEKGLSQKELADFADLDRTHISDIERGIHSPSIWGLFKLSEPLGVKPHDLIERVWKELKKKKPDH